MLRHISLAVAISVALLIANSSAQSTQPTDTADRIDQLVQELGNEEFSKREQAHAQLRAMGARAQHALTRGAESENPEIRDRCRSLLDQLAGLELADSNTAPQRRATVRGLNVGPVGIAGNLRVQMVGPGGGRQAVREENGRAVTLVEDAEGITLTIREERDGKQVEETFKAKTPEELKHKNAEAYQEYEQFGPAPIPRGLVGKGIAVDGDMRAIILDNHLLDLQRAQRQAEAMADNILKQLDGDMRALQERVIGPGLIEQDIVRRLMDEMERMGALRPMRERMIEPLPGNRPDRGLGVLVNEPDEVLQAHLGKGLVVERVMPGSAAEKAGIQRFDFIKRVNDREIANVTELREAIELEGKITLELIRKGEKLTVTVE
jgi:hypothetical protein